MAEDIKLMKGNEAIAHAAIRYGVDGYFGYPITPQSEILETLMAEMPWEKTGMVVLQAESEVAAINMVYGGAGTGKKVMTSSSSPGVSLKQEGISYIAGAELPCLIVNVMRGGPGLGTIQPSQADYFQTVKGGGHGDYRLITLAPSSVQEMADFVGLGFDLAFKYNNPAIILADGIIGQMMEKVVLPPYQPRRTEEEIIAQCPWAVQGKKGGRKGNVITSLELDQAKMEENNIRLQAKYRKIEENEVCGKKKLLSVGPETKYEPQNALFAPNQGLYFYEKIIEKIGKLTKKPKLVAFEIGMTQKEAIKNLAQKYLSNCNIYGEKDLTNRDRYIFITFE